MDTRELVERVRRGNREAVTSLVETHQRAVYGFLLARLPRPSDALALAEGVFVRAITSRGRVARAADARAWLIGIAREVLRERARGANREDGSAWTDLCLELDDLAAPDGQAHDDLLARLPGCLEKLDASVRQALELRHAGRLDLAEIGARLRRSEDAVRLLLARARGALRSCIAAKDAATAAEP